MSRILHDNYQRSLFRNPVVDRAMSRIFRIHRPHPKAKQLWLVVIYKNKSIMFRLLEYDVFLQNSMSAQHYPKSIIVSTKYHHNNNNTYKQNHTTITILFIFGCLADARRWSAVQHSAVCSNCQIFVPIHFPRHIWDWSIIGQGSMYFHYDTS